MRYLMALVFVLIFLASCAKIEEVEPVTEVEKEELKEEIYSVDPLIIVQNEELTDDLYSCELLNTGNIDKECLAVLEITSEGQLINEIEKYVGIIKPNQVIPVEIEFGSMPGGETLFEVIPRCK